MDRYSSGVGLPVFLNTHGPPLATFFVGLFHADGFHGLLFVVFHGIQHLLRFAATLLLLLVVLLVLLGLLLLLLLLLILLLVLVLLVLLLLLLVLILLVLILLVLVLVLLVLATAATLTLFGTQQLQRKREVVLCVSAVAL